jgi:hypothetical protein
VCSFGTLFDMLLLLSLVRVTIEGFGFVIGFIEHVQIVFLSFIVFNRSLNSLVSTEKGYGLEVRGFDS